LQHKVVIVKRCWNADTQQASSSPSLLEGSSGKAQNSESPLITTIQGSVIYFILFWWSCQPLLPRRPRRGPPHVFPHCSLSIYSVTWGFLLFYVHADWSVSCNLGLWYK
jgi:hypothetical protein